MYTYRMALTWSEGEQYWIAEAPDAGAVGADGLTPEAAIAHLQEALRVSLSVAKERGIRVPAPRSYEQIMAEEDAAHVQTSASV